MKQQIITHYKHCFVPKCKNNVVTAPDKLYFPMPHDPNARKKWCHAMSRDNLPSCKSTLHCCEDHFEIENDTENYIEYKIMVLEHGKRMQLRLKKGVVPHIFECQKIVQSLPPTEKKGALKRKQPPVEEALTEAALSEAKRSGAGPNMMSSSQPDLIEAGRRTVAISQADLLEAGPSTAAIPQADLLEAGPSTESIHYAHKAVQVSTKIHYRSKGVNVTVKKNSVAISPHLILTKNMSTSPLKSAQVKRKLFSDNSADIVSVTSVSSQSSDYEPEHSTSDSSWLIEEEDNDLEFKNLMRSGTLMAIEREPKMLLGLPKNTFYLIKLLSEHVPIPTINILITLRKIKINESFSLLAVNFGYSQSTISRIFSKSVAIISKTMKELIVWPTPSQIFEKLPISFRARYSDVVSIIDCLEIQIEKPTNPVHQSLSWSQYKKCNTIKYLISSTPDGLVNYISDGYSGRATDFSIVEDCGYLEYLPPQKAVMADRGFKDLSRLLSNRNCTLVRPPTVSKCTPSTKKEVKLTKQIAALRIHIERVIGRLREFSMLLPHACVDHNLIPVMDEVIVVACGLINLQDVLIKK